MENFNYSELKCRLSEMIKVLENLQDEMLKTQVNYQVLWVELCTQFSPYMMEAVYKTDINCQDCSQIMMKGSLVSRQEISTYSSDLIILPSKK